MPKTALSFLAITFFSCLILYLFNSAAIAFNERCHQRFYLKPLNFKAFTFTTAALSLTLLGYFYNTAAYSLQSYSPKDGITLLVLGILGLFLVGWHNFQKTNWLFGLIANLVLLLVSTALLIPVASTIIMSVLSSANYS
ncbi:hypothetical protein FAI40_05015 [Acetobacteraceae bacterium]|nr:hypothetical protein FAI40_05015 [Acetobacteraceae bacterium]